MNLFDIEVDHNNQTVKISMTDNTWIFAFNDLNNHSASWLINQLVLETDAEVIL